MSGACVDITEVRMISASLETTRTEAVSANRAKSAFLANMSHEIRTPLNAVLGFAQLLRRDRALTEPQRKQVDTILRGGELLLALINDILELSKVEAGRSTVVESTIDLDALLDDVGTLFRVRAEDKGLRLLVEPVGTPDRLLVTDEAKLRQVLMNLLGNAVKFTERGGVALRAKVAPGPGEAGAGRLVVEVEDTGPGIAPEELPRLFQVFEQTETGRRSRSGTGLGLAISLRFAELLGGTLGVASSVGKGSTFTLELPVRPGVASAVVRPLAPARAVTALAPDQQTFRVLVADDNQDNRDFLGTLLLSLGFAVRTAADGAQTVREFADWRPQLILMDMRMPVLSGHDAIGQVRGLAGGADVRIIAVTASAFQEDRLAALAAGADEFVGKPFREEVLLEKIQALLGVRYVRAETDVPLTRETSGSRPIAWVAWVAALPAELVAELRQATLCADLGRILELADQVEVPPALAAEIRLLAERFSYPQLLTLLESAECGVRSAE
jgi:CheY-like chemotaxis protein/nitrogen-specific signal transduction histidine kinase